MILPTDDDARPVFRTEPPMCGAELLRYAPVGDLPPADDGHIENSREASGAALVWCLRLACALAIVFLLYRFRVIR